MFHMFSSVCRYPENGVVFNVRLFQLTVAKMCTFLVNGTFIRNNFISLCQHRVDALECYEQRIYDINHLLDK